MKIATWNINSVRRRLSLVVDWLTANQPDVLCLQETKVQDCDFPADAFRDAGYILNFRGMKGYNGVATLTRREPELVRHGLCEGADSEDVRILETVVAGIPIVNTYVPQGHKVGTDKYVFKLEWFHRVRRYFKEHLDPGRDQSPFHVGCMRIRSRVAGMLWRPVTLRADPGWALFCAFHSCPFSHLEQGCV